MSDDRWERIQALFTEARELPAGERDAWLAEQGDAADILAEVRGLLGHDDPAPLFKTPARVPTVLSPALSEKPDPELAKLSQGLRAHRTTLIILGLAIVGLVTVGLITREKMVDAISLSSRSQLEAVRNLASKSIEEWLDDERLELSYIASDQGLPGLVAELTSQVDGLLDEDQRVERLTSLLADLRAGEAGPVQRLDEEAALRTHYGWAIVARDGLVLATGGPMTLDQLVDPRLPGQYVKPESVPLAARAFLGEHPFLPPTRGVDNLDPTAPPFMAMIEPVRRPDGAVVAGLAFVIEPAGRFTTTLHQARMGETGETYAFDADGRMLSASRFEQDLWDLGLLGRGLSSALNLRVGDPGGNLLSGFELGDPSSFPATEAVRIATASRKAGMHFAGYRDYRGVPVVGAWTWLEHYGFGILTEINEAEVRRPLDLLTVAGLVLASMALLGVIVVLASIVLSLRVKEGLERVIRLGNYTLDEVLGRGGMGIVYLGHHAHMERPVAIKVVRRDRADDRTLKRMERELQACARLTHPNTIEVYDCGFEAGGQLYFVMEYLDGVTWYDLVTGAGPLPAARVVHLMRQVAGSLREAHNKGLVHRDIKPSNLVVCERGEILDVVKVLDFGLVKDIQHTPGPGDLVTERLSGTPLYMAPERLRNQDVDGRADLFALGATAYVMLTGRQAHSGKTPAEMAAAILKETPSGPARHAPHPVPAELDALVLSLLAPDREDRPADAQAVLDALDAVPVEPWTQADAAAFWEQEGPRLRSRATTRRMSPPTLG
jgi:hypothetical protein